MNKSGSDIDPYENIIIPTKDSCVNSAFLNKVTDIYTVHSVLKLLANEGT